MDSTLLHFDKLDIHRKSLVRSYIALTFPTLFAPFATHSTKHNTTNADMGTIDEMLARYYQHPLTLPLAFVLDSRVTQGKNCAQNPQDSTQTQSHIAANTAQLPHITPQEIAILLSATSHNLAQYVKSTSFQAIITHIHALSSQTLISYTPHNTQNIQSTQSVLNSSQYAKSCDISKLESTLPALQIILLAHTSAPLLQTSIDFLSHISAAGVLQAEFARKLLALMRDFFHALQAESTHTQTPQTSRKSIDKKALEDELYSISATLLQINPNAKHALESTQHKLQNSRFSIGVAGVLSAGKSSFLNALLGQEILGTSSIPETANLTILRYGKPKAVVYFLPPTHTPPHATHTLTREQAELQAVGSKHIELDELATYTSANHPSRFCEIVERVELELDMKFLANGTEIVDTPGIDDPVVLREELTRSYMRHCDMLIYVMNASCAATQKDMDFILESLLSGHLARLLIVLTRADLLSQDELESSLAYTRTSLERALQKARYDGDIHALLERIDFISVASLYALAYKRDDAAMIAQAKENGFNQERSGIVKVEQYLDAMLFSDNAPKQRDMLYSAYRSLLSELESTRQELHAQERILQSSNADRNAIIQELIAKEQRLMDSMNDISTHLDTMNRDFIEYLEHLLARITTHLSSHTQRLFTQLYDDSLYEYAKNSKPTRERTESIITRSLQDSYDDIVREYRYKLTKKLSDISDLGLIDMPHISEEISIEIPPITYTNQENAITIIAAAINERAYTAISSHHKGTQERLSGTLQAVLQEGMQAFSTLLAQENARIQAIVLQAFETYKHAHKSALEQKIAHTISVLESTKSKSQESLPELKTAQQTLQSLKNEVQIILKALR